MTPEIGPTVFVGSAPASSAITERFMKYVHVEMTKRNTALLQKVQELMDVLPKLAVSIVVSRIF